MLTSGNRAAPSVSTCAFLLASVCYACNGLARLRPVLSRSPRSYVPEWVGIGTEADFTSSIHTLIEKDRKNFIIYGTDRISARAPTAEEQQVLTIPDSLPLLIVRRTSYTDHDYPIEYSEAATRSDLYEYIITLPREI